MAGKEDNLYGKDTSKRKVGLNFNFGLEIDGMVEISFMKVSGISSEVEFLTYNEGGVNDYEHHIPTKVKYSNIVLEKGVTKSDVLFKWFKRIQAGIIEKKNFSVILWNNEFKVIKRWNFIEGYPVKWSLSNFEALGNGVSIESIEFTHNGFNT
ncbi:phage tail protein [Helicovermis profundi]|uniref:Phage tail protein n=1 Tax=Helicovermis profundi TaxID=3065157 RepID=A0AAU9EHP1_9FIRM|nr:phage tail protein [Clostridia bacterium S502]